MSLDGDDHDLINRRFDSLEELISACREETDALLLAILNQLRKQRGEMAVTLQDVMDGKVA